MATIKYKDENGQWQEIAIGGGGSITLDSEMSDTSTNAVSNKVIKEYVDNAVVNSGGGTDGGGEALTLYVLTSKLNWLLSKMGVSIESMPFYAEMCERNAEVYSLIAQMAENKRNVVVLVDNKTYVIEFAKAMGLEVTWHNTQCLPAQMDYANFNTNGNPIEDEDVHIFYESVRDEVCDRITLHSDGTFNVESLYREVYYGDKVTEEDKSNNKFVYDNWKSIYRLHPQYITYVGRRDAPNASFAAYILGICGIEAKIFVLETEGTIGRVGITDTGEATLTTMALSSN